MKTSRPTGDGDATRKKKWHCGKCSDQHPPPTGKKRRRSDVDTGTFDYHVVPLDQLFMDLSSQSQRSSSPVSQQTVEVRSCPPSYGNRIDALDTVVGSIQQVMLSVQATLPALLSQQNYSNSGNSVGFSCCPFYGEYK